MVNRFISKGNEVIALNVHDPAHPRETVRHAATNLSEYSRIHAADGLLYVVTESDITILRHGSTPTGQIRDSLGLPVAGTSLLVNTQPVTASGLNGAYTVTAPDGAGPANTATVQPRLPGMTFWPESYLLTPGMTGQDFLALPERVSVSATPEAATTLTLKDVLGAQTQVTIPAGTVTTSMTAELSAMVPPYRQDEVLVSTAFVLDVGTESTFAQPLPVHITYREAGVRVVRNDVPLILRQWNGTDWDAVQVTCPASSIHHDPTRNTVVTSICEPGQYALFGATNRLFLPLHDQ